MSFDPDIIPCGLLRVGDDGRVLASNAAFAALRGGQAATGRLQELLRPASLLYYQLSFFPSLRIAGRVEEVYLELNGADGGAVPVLINARRDPEARHSDWAVMRVEQRGRWEDAVVEARKRAEEESAKLAEKSAELAEAKAGLEHALKELKETNWLLNKVAEVLPSCMYCGRVKPGGDASWESAIDFLKRNSRFVSHGCCPRCVKQLREQMGFVPREGGA